METMTISGVDSCVFCCKPSENWENNSSERKLLLQFTKHLQRFTGYYEQANPSFLKGNNNQNGWSWSNGLACCKNCLLIVSNFCEDYHQLKCLELKLEFGLVRLIDKIELGEMPPNIKLEQTLEPINELPEELNGTGKTGDSGEGTMSAYKTFRDKIIKICNQRISQSQPRVKLKHVMDLSIPPPDPLEISEPPKPHTKKTDYYKCPKCEETLNCAYNLNRHLVKHHQTWRCFKCHQDFKSYNKLYFHNSATHKPPPESAVTQGDSQKSAPLVCQLCEKSFKNVLYLKKHLGRMHADKKDPETGWNKYINESDFVVVERQEIEEEIVKTDPETVAASEHIKFESGGVGGVIQEDIPNGGNFQNASEFEIEVKYHMGPKEIEAVPRHLTNPTESSNKSDETSSKPDATFDCRECSKSFATKRKLRIHQLGVHGCYRCRDCGEVYQSRVLYKSHVLTHQDSPQWKCNVCGKGFITKSMMEEHVQCFHENGPGVPCTVCQKTFLSKRRMTAHIKAVHVEGRFKCPECGKGFKKGYHLKLHMIGHQGEAARTIKCNDCGKMFTRRPALRSHVRNAKRKVQTEVLVCQLCGKTLACCDSLGWHYSLHHREVKKNLNKKGNMTQNGISSSK